ncbi:hypothetical protein [Sporisorium scitamineum]|uniref:Uncharacterized protein n=1 Tax=Sporisorium scitamineum TaxID=49012 RepID=A0A0F7S8J9_9BASI|nr:hypothetical protein [Sporisorium scitamineum]
MLAVLKEEWSGYYAAGPYTSTANITPLPDRGDIVLHPWQGLKDTQAWC